jgi:hypothetical protein
VGRYITEHSSTTAFVAKIKQRTNHNGGRDGKKEINEEGRKKEKIKNVYMEGRNRKMNNKNINQIKINLMFV